MIPSRSFARAALVTLMLLVPVAGPRLGHGLWAQQPARPVLKAGEVVRLGEAGLGKEAAVDLGTLLLPESANLNRILDRVSDFFARDQWEQGCEVLQDLLEGRAVEVGPEKLDDPAYSVYSENLRLYVPFTRYCQRLLSRLPAEGLEVYRLRFDARAKEALDAARANDDIEALARAVEVFFASSYGPELVLLLADLVTLRGEIERALYLRERLLLDYPDLSDAQKRWARLRQLHGLALLGEKARFDKQYQDLLAQEPGGAVRVNGELVPFAQIKDHPAFRLRSGGERRGDDREELPLSSLKLFPLWDFALTDQDPYGLRKKTLDEDRRVFWGSPFSAGMVVPKRKTFRPGLRLLSGQLGEGRSALMFKDKDRLVVLDAVSGMLVREHLVSGSRTRSAKNEGQLHARLASTDYGTSAVVRDGDRLYFTVENRVLQDGNRYPYRNRLACFDLKKNATLWVTANPPGTQERIFFQTPPVRYRDRLYAPVRKGRSFRIASLDADTGELLATVTVHSGGTRLLRVPVQRPRIVGDLLVHASNAGAIVAFRLPDLKLCWLRRYETRTPHQQVPRPRRVQMRGFGYRVQTVALEHWKPVRPIVQRDRVIVAPLDGDALLCLSVQTGKVQWLLPRKEVGYRRSEFDELIGPVDGRVFLVGSHLQCVSAVSGKRLWEKSLESYFEGRHQGRGVVHGGRIYLPDNGWVHVFSADTGEHQARLLLSPISTQKASLSDPVNLTVHGGMLFAASDDRIRAYAVPDDLVANSKSEYDRVRRMVAVQRIVAATEALRALLVQRVLAGDSLIRARDLFVRLSGELAGSELESRGAELAFQVLNDCEQVLRKAGLRPDPRLLLFRIELSERLGRMKDVWRLRESLLSMPIEEVK
ncbi:MAG: hypothetical protein CSA62_05455 [Planctomycetota bacterium]|nr:MAG: hypothetical protein CSA62_05455 [Planctomycetota bacterium]